MVLSVIRQRSLPKANPQRPNGNRKLFSEESASAFDVNPYEPSWTKGFTVKDNFDGDMLSGIGPFFAFQVGESITIAWAEAGGFLVSKEFRML